MTTVCYSPNGGNHSVSSFGFTEYDEASSSLSSPSSSPTDERHKQSPTSPFEVRTHGVDETEALLRVCSRSGARALSFAWRQGQEKTALRQKQQRRHDHENYLHHHCYHQPYKDAYPEEEYDETKERWEDTETLDEGADSANAGYRSETRRRSLAGAVETGTDNVPRLPCLFFPEFGRMVGEAEIPSTAEGSGIPTPGHMESVEKGASLSGSPASKDSLLGCLDDFCAKEVGGHEVPERSTRDRFGMYRPTSDEFEGWQMDEDDAPHDMSYDIPRPATGLGWYEDDESAVGDAPTTGEHNSGELNPSMSTVFDNTNCFLRPDTEDDWLGPKPVRWGSVSYDSVELSSNSVTDDSDHVSPTSSRFLPVSSEEEEIDNLLDIYATCSDRKTLSLTPSAQEGNLPPYPSYHPSALALSSQSPAENLARNANIIRYLALHCIPSPSINPIEHTTDLVEPILPPPLPQYSSFAQNYPQHPRRREYTRLLQAIRSVRWSADAINGMLAVVDFSPPPPGRGRHSTALPMFRKLRAADAQRRGCLTSAQLHRLHCHGVSLLDVLQMNDIPKVVTCGLGGRLVEAAESGALGVARECNLLDEEGALLELLADPNDLAAKSPGNERRGWAGKGSGLRNCVGVDEDENVATGDWNEGYDEEALVRSFVDDEGGGHGVDDIPYTVSPLSPEATFGEQSWDQRDISPLTTSYRAQELETLFHEVRSLSSGQNCQTDATAPDQGHTTLERTHGLRPCRDRGILVDDEAARSPEMQRLFHEIGAAPVVSGSNVPKDAAARGPMEEAGFGNEGSQAAPGHESWGVDLGGPHHDPPNREPAAPPPLGCVPSYASGEYPTLTLGFTNTPRLFDSGLSTWIRQHSLASRCFPSANESGTARNSSLFHPFARDTRNGAAGIATIPFQQLRTGTASENASIASLLSPARKYGHRERVVVVRRLGEVERARRGVEAVVGVEQGEDVVRLSFNVRFLNLARNGIRLISLLPLGVLIHPSLSSPSAGTSSTSSKCVLSSSTTLLLTPLLPSSSSSAHLDEVQHRARPVVPDQRLVVVVHAGDVHPLRAPRPLRVVPRGPRHQALHAQGVQQRVDGEDEDEVAEAARAKEPPGAEAQAVEDAH
ncbi:hypothetical protein Ct61P_00890 [Colletotrichum tofieldiae]|nr:hypothetical protein Ct61P_00890 [Colletotrichum tofieldiae]